jgi:hypothetical protein
MKSPLFTPINLKGEVFDAGGKVGCVVPPSSSPLPGRILFEVLGEYPPHPDWPRDGFPAWADMYVEKQPCRIAPEIVKNLPRLADCVMVVSQYKDRLLSLPLREAIQVTMPSEGHPEAQTFLFWRDQMGGPGRKMTLIVIDTLGRARASTVQVRHEIRDGQWRVSPSKSNP